MQDFTAIGKWIILAGIVMVVLGGLIWLLGRLRLFENLLGVLRMQTGGITCVIPILASILISIVLTVIINIALRLINR